MRIIKCDKCGEKMDIPEYRSYEVYVRTDDGLKPLDICDRCYKQFTTWIVRNNDNVSDEPMTVRQILEKFEKWLMSKPNFAIFDSDNGICVFRGSNGVSAIDEYLEAKGIEK